MSNKPYINPYNNPMGIKPHLKNIEPECKHKLTPEGHTRLVCEYCGETFKF